MYVKIQCFVNLAWLVLVYSSIWQAFKMPSLCASHCSEVWSRTQFYFWRFNGLLESRGKENINEKDEHGRLRLSSEGFLSWRVLLFILWMLWKVNKCHGPNIQQLFCKWNIKHMEIKIIVLTCNMALAKIW